MKRTLVAGLTVLFLLQAVAISAMTPAGLGTLPASGIIDVDKSTVTAPRITAPSIVTPMNSFAKTSSVAFGAAIDAEVKASVEASTLDSGSTPKRAGRPQPTANPIQPVGVLRAVYVSDGGRVRKGALLAKIDDQLLRLALERNRAALSQARARVHIADNRLEDLEEKARDIEDARDEIVANKAKLANARDRLAEGEAKLSNAEERLAKQKSRIMSMKIPKLPKIPPGTPLPVPIPKAPTKMPDPAKLKAGLARAEAALAMAREKIDEGYATIDSFSAKLADAEAKLDEAEEKLAEGRRKLTTARWLAVVNARVVKTSVSSSATELGKAIVRSPAAGVVTDLDVQPGELVFANQPLMKIASVDRAKLKLFLPPDEIQMIAKGRKAEVSIDTFDNRSFPATVTIVGSTVQFAPANIATERTYLSEVQDVTLTIDNPEGILKEGMPADAEIDLE